MLRAIVFRVITPFVVAIMAIMFFINHMHKATVADFYGNHLSLAQHLNWYKIHPVNTVEAQVVLAAKRPSHPGGNTTDWCPHVHQDEGMVRISYVDNQPVCCALGKGQRYIHYREDESTISFLCGRWPQADIVSINKSGFNAAQFKLRSSLPVN